jgi:thiamine-monophosphate kinase
MSETVADLGEHALIEHIRARAGTPPEWIALGIGDDAAVIEPERGSLDVVTTDALIEDVHFRRAWTAPDAIGHKAIAACLSDLAAMGARPRASFLSLALPAALPAADVFALVDAFITLATQAGAPLAGGNVARSPGPLVVDTTAMGAARRRRILTRGGARPGDLLFVTGAIGAAAAGLAMLEAGVDRAALDPPEAECIGRYERPDARLRCGTVVAGNRAATACVDLSDGLADAARQIAAASRTGVVLEADDLPVHPGARSWAAQNGGDPVALALAGGEDYELLFAVSPRATRRFLGAMRRSRGLVATRIGRLTAEPGAWLHAAGRMEPLARGFVHF